MMPISEAVRLANSLKPNRYPITQQTADTLRNAARRGKIKGAAKPYTQWLFDENGLTEWVQDTEAHRPGPKGHSETEN